MNLKTIQKEAFSMRNVWIFAIALCCLIGVSNHLAAARSSELSSEKLLASVSIEDLVGPTEDSEPATAETDSEAEKSKAAVETELLEQAKVQEKQILLSEAMVLDEIRYQVASHFELKGDFRIYFDQPWSEMKLNNPDWEIVMTSFPSKGLRSRFYVGFELWVGGKRHSTWQEGVHCELWNDAYVVIQQVDRGTVLREGLVAVRPVDTLGLYQGPVDVGIKLNDYIADNGLKVGEPLVWRDLRERPLIQKNALIDVVAEEGLLKITLKAKAMEDGVKGQVIRIRNLQSYNDIQAEVIGVNQAKVYF